jgi:hypothetical protein
MPRPQLSPTAHVLSRGLQEQHKWIPRKCLHPLKAAERSRMLVGRFRTHTGL